MKIYSMAKVKHAVPIQNSTCSFENSIMINWLHQKLEE